MRKLVSLSPSGASLNTLEQKIRMSDRKPDVSKTYGWVIGGRWGLIKPCLILNSHLKLKNAAESFEIRPTFLIFLSLMTKEIMYYLIGMGGVPGGSAAKTLPANVGDSSSVPGLVRFPGGGNGNPFHYSYLDNPKERGAWWATVHGVVKSWSWLSTNAHINRYRNNER